MNPSVLCQETSSREFGVRKYSIEIPRKSATVFIFGKCIEDLAVMPTSSVTIYTLIQN